MKPRPRPHRVKSKSVQPILLSPAEVKVNLANQLTLDVQPEKFMTHVLPGAQRLNVDILLKDIDQGQPVLVTCLTGQRSLRAAQQMIERGYRQVYVLKDGLVAWQRAGYTVQPTKRPA